MSAINQIDQTLARVTAALGGAGLTAKAGVTPPASRAAKGPKQSVQTKAGAGPRKGRRSKFAVSTSDLVLSFVKANGSPTTQAIMQHLANEGRTVSSGSNALSTLATAKKLKRTPLGKGIMGSTYSLP